MDSIIQKLSEIETAACSIVEHAEAQKEMLDTQIKERTKDFDEKLAADTNAKSENLRQNLKIKMEKQLSLLRDENSNMLQSLKNEYNTKHELYAQEILKRITEV